MKKRYRSYLKILKQRQKTDSRYPENLHVRENNLNNFFYNVTTMDTAQCRALFQHTPIPFIFALVGNTLTVGIEIPFRHLEYFKKIDVQQANILDSQLRELIVEHYASIDKKLSKHDIAYTQQDLTELIYEFMTKEEKEHIQSNNANLLKLLQHDRTVRKLIKSHFQQGHPAIIENSYKSGAIGGEMQFDKDLNKWITYNKSGRYGRIAGNQMIALYLHATHLLKIQLLLQERGIKVQAQVFFKPHQMSTHMQMYYGLVNLALVNFSNTGIVSLSKKQLACIPTLLEKTKFELGLWHIQTHAQHQSRLVQRPKSRPNHTQYHGQLLSQFKNTYAPKLKPFHSSLPQSSKGNYR